jgi:hypothetical protein
MAPTAPQPSLPVPILLEQSVSILERTCSPRLHMQPQLLWPHLSQQAPTLQCVSSSSGVGRGLTTPLRDEYACHDVP